MSLSYKDVAEILKIIDASDCRELVLELEGARLVVRRDGAGQGAAEPARAAAAAAPSPVSPARSREPSSPAAEQSKSEPDAQAGVIIRAPMVGTFYRRPSPEKEAFVREGARVAVGDPLALIEVMKLYTTLESTVAGTVTAIGAEDGALVEYDQPLFTITPD